NRSANGKRDDGDRLGGVVGWRHSLRPPRYDEVHLEPDQLGRQVGQPVDPTLRISIVDDNILALNPPELAQPLPERVEVGRPVGRGRQIKKTYPRHPPRLLRFGGQRRREESRAQGAEERAAVHHGNLIIAVGWVLRPDALPISSHIEGKPYCTANVPSFWRTSGRL